MTYRLGRHECGLSEANKLDPINHGVATHGLGNAESHGADHFADDWSVRHARGGSRLLPPTPRSAAEQQVVTEATDLVWNSVGRRNELPAELATNKTASTEAALEQLNLALIEDVARIWNEL